MNGEFINLYYSALIASSVVMFITWIIYLIIKNPSIVDVSWGICISLCGYIFFKNQPDHNISSYIIMILLIIWMVRLSGFLFYTRIIPRHIDPRYIDLKNSMSNIETINYLLNYQLQALLSSIISITLYFCFKNSDINILFIIGVLLVIIGIIGESISDYQLYNFKKYNHNQICQVGFWRYSRHPNYFYELVVWFGFAAIAFNINKLNSLLALVSPLMLLFIMKYWTIRFTETHMLKNKPGFEEYKSRTNALLPFQIGCNNTRL